LLRPDAPSNNAFRYCLINAALRCESDVLLPCAMSNHYHVELVYTATNPVLDHLVGRVHHWPGVNGLGALLAGRSAARNASAALLPPRRPDAR
jgi:hypothetical protein